jgi:acetyl-CoA acetyltransferase
MSIRTVTWKEDDAGLPTVFKKMALATAANASGICDGAGSIVIASKRR